MNVLDRASSYDLKMHMLAGMTQWIECQPANQRVAGSVPSQGTCLGFRPGPWWGIVRGNHTLMFLPLIPPPPP